MWTEIERVDEEGVPVAGERFVVTTADRRTIEGALDAHGHPRLDGLKPGSCRVDFPRLDGRAWS